MGIFSNLNSSKKIRSPKTLFQVTVKCTTIEVSIIPNSIFPLISFPPVKKRFILLLMCMYVCMYVYVPMETQRGPQIFWS